MRRAGHTHNRSSIYHLCAHRSAELEDELGHTHETRVEEHGLVFRQVASFQRTPGPHGVFKVETHVLDGIHQSLQCIHPFRSPTRSRARWSASISSRSGAERFSFARKRPRGTRLGSTREQLA
eukprot:7382336-Prymnesium_polylepis.1